MSSTASNCSENRVLQAANFWKHLRRLFPSFCDMADYCINRFSHLTRCALPRFYICGSELRRFRAGRWPCVRSDFFPGVKLVFVKSCQKCCTLVGELSRSRRCWEFWMMRESWELHMRFGWAGSVFNGGVAPDEKVRGWSHQHFLTPSVSISSCNSVESGGSTSISQHNLKHFQGWNRTETLVWSGHEFVLRTSWPSRLSCAPWALWISASGN